MTPVSLVVVIASVVTVKNCGINREMENYSLQFASDIHLEFNVPPFDQILQPTAKDLALIGDIGSPWEQVYTDFLRWCSVRWDRVFVLAGNHEYFAKAPETWNGVDKTMPAVDRQIRKVCSAVGKNVIFLQEDAYFIESHKIIVMGATLWTAPDLRRWDMLGPAVIGDGPGCRGDYKDIYLADEYTGKIRNAHPSDITRLHTQHTAVLRRFLNSSWGRVPPGWRVVVLTHHVPTQTLNPPEFSTHALRTCYASDLDSMLNEPVVAWLCGHSHKANDARFDSGCLVALNPYGYKHEQGRTNYDSHAHIIVYPENIAMIRH